MIAAHAISIGMALITNNQADFTQYRDDGLAIENRA